MISDDIQEHRQVLDSLESIQSEIEALRTSVVDCFRSGNRLYACGNGGSAAEAQHLASELVGKLLPAMSLCTDPSAVTATANDFGFEGVFARQVKSYGRPLDLLLVFSTSGKSINCVHAAQVAIAMGMQCCALTGEVTSALSEVASMTIHVPSSNTQRIQEMHHLITHLIYSYVEEML